MRIAYLILAHNTPGNLQRLITALSSDSASFFVHVDRKSNIADFSAVAGPEVHFTKERAAVHWGDFSVVEAILILIRTVLSAPIEFDRFVLLSAADYPVKSASFISTFFESHPDKEFMDIVAMPSVAFDKPISRLNNYRLRRSYPRIAKIAHRLLVKYRILHRKRNYKHYFGSLAPYAGDTWWALTRSACSYILDFVDNQPRLMRFYRNTLCPSESVFQTILGNSAFRSRIVNNLTYADWSAGGAHPAIIADQHVALLEATNHATPKGDYYCLTMLFARKFTEDSGELVQEIDRRLREPNNELADSNAA